MTRDSGWTSPALLALALAFPPPALAQEFLAKPIRIIVGPGPDTSR